MFTEISLHNFQAHKDTTLELDPGINCIVGTSDSGKTAILRGFKWCYENRPTGTNFISHWCKKEDTSVHIETTEGPITRVRNEKRNGYDVDGVELGAIGTDVPEQVRELFNMSNVNISNQDDPPFLLAETAGDVAKYLNKIIHLDLIDTVLSNAESMKRGLKKDVTEVERSINEELQQIEQFSWLEKAQKALSHLQEKETLLETILQKRKSLQVWIDSTTERQGFLDKNKQIIESFRKVSIEDLISNLEKVQKYIQSLSSLVSSILPMERLVQKKEVLDKIKKVFSKIDILSEDRKIALKSKQELSDILHKGEQFKKIADEKSLELVDLKKELPEICPSCGRPMEACSEV